MRSVLNAAGLLSLILALGVITSEGGEQDYFKSHPLTQEQIEANRHFARCWELRTKDNPEWTAGRRQYLLDAEGCHRDARLDPRIKNATYPWNPDAPHPLVN